MANDITITLTARGKRYGEFKDQARLTQGIKRVYEGGKNWHAMPDIQREALEMIASKLARILNGDNNYADSYHDIGGYARLVESELSEKITPQPDPQVATPPRYVASGPAYQGSGSISAAPVADPIPAAVIEPIVPASPPLPGGPIARAE